MNQIQRLETWERSLAVAETFEEISLINSSAAAAAELARREKLSLEKQNEIGRFRIEIAAKKGEWLDEHFPSDRSSNQYLVGSQGAPSTMPVSKKESSQSRNISRTKQENPSLLNSVMDEIEENGDVITPNKVDERIKRIQNIRQAFIDCSVVVGSEEVEEEGTDPVFPKVINIPDEANETIQMCNWLDMLYDEVKRHRQPKEAIYNHMVEWNHLDKFLKEWDFVKQYIDELINIKNP
jgi:hypothetical protein